MKKKNSYITLIFILLILIIITISLIIYLNNSEKYRNTMDLNQIDNSQEAIKELERVSNKKEYLRVKQCLNNFVSTINQNSSIYYGYDINNNYTIIAEQDVINTNLYSVLSSEYINKNSITIVNANNFVYEIKKDCFYIPIDIYEKNKNLNVKIYAVYGVIVDTDYNPMAQSYLILNIDEINNTFSVEQLKNKEELNSIEIKNIVSIENKINNVYHEAGIIDENIIIDYITTYKRLALAYPEIVYENYLDEEYKKEKFNSLEEFKEYVNNNKEEIKSINIQKYDVQEQNGYTQYTAIDQKEKNYIVNVTDINNFKILLDNYTIDTPQFVKTYNSSNEQSKVGYNIQKVVDAINNKDYSYVYKKLDNTFKQNNYQTEEIFENFIKNNLFEKNSIEKDTDVSNEGEIYIYEIKVKNLNNENEYKNMTVIMKLNEGTDFTMSFNIKQ